MPKTVPGLPLHLQFRAFTEEFCFQYMLLKFFIFKFSFINLCHHIARANSVCLDTVTTPFKGHGLRQIDYTGLGGTVERKCACTF